jgi:biotin synthase
LPLIFVFCVKKEKIMGKEWSLQEIKDIYSLPLFSLISQAHILHLKYHKVGEIQVCTLISYKTGGCPEDCKYCAQSTRYRTSVKSQPYLTLDQIVNQASQAIENGASRICIGAAWRKIPEGRSFDLLLEAIKAIAEKGVEVCCTLGFLTEDQALRLKKAGLFAYNHNLDTSAGYYDKIITTRTYEDRLKTLDTVEQTGLSVCCGGILGLGESIEDRIHLIHTLATRKNPPESIPINVLTPISGTPLENAEPVAIWDLLRMIAAVRIVMPKARIRLSAGRLERNQEEQALCFFAGANSIFSGEKLLTAPNPTFQDDERLFSLLGLKKEVSFEPAS